MANEVQFVYSATVTTAVSLAAALANNAYTYSGLASCTMNAVDNSTTKYPHARFVLDVPDTFAAAPTAGGGFNVYMLINDSDGTGDDTPPPDSTAIKNAQWVAWMPISAYDVAHQITVRVPNCLDGVTSADFIIENKTGQAASYSSNPVTLKVTPYSHVPAA